MNPVIDNLRQTILRLAMEGKLVAQDPQDGSADGLLAKVESKRRGLIDGGEIRKGRQLPPINEGEKPFDIPSTWRWVRLGAASSYAHLNRVEPDDIPEGHWVLDLGDVEARTSKVIRRELSDDRKPESTKTIFEEGDIIYGRLRPYLNKIIIADSPGVCTSEMIPIRAFGFSQKYLFYYLKGPHFLGQVNALTKGINLPRLTTNDAIMQLVPLPPLAEQERIVAKVDELMRLCDLLEDKSKTLSRVVEAIGQTILRLAVEGKLVPQDPSDEPAHRLLGAMKAERQRLIEEGLIRTGKPLSPIADSEKPFEIPESWEWVRLGEITEINIGKTPSRSLESHWRNGIYNWVTIADMIPFGSVTETKELVSKEAHDERFHSKIVPPGTLMLSFKLTLGRTSILGKPAFHNEGIVSLPFYLEKKKLTRFYLWAIPPLGIDERKTNAVKGSTLNKAKLRQLVVPLPPLDEQRRITDELDALMGIRDRLRSRTEDLARQKLVAGKLAKRD